MDETFEVTLSLRDEAARAERIPIPLRNVRFVGQPSEHARFESVNGRATRQRLLRYTARALAEGTASIGPIRIETGSGVVEIDEVVVTVLPSLLEEDLEPEDALRRLERESREAVLVDLELDRNEAVVGEQILATWILYAGDPITSPTIVGLPELDGFWVEEIPEAGRRSTEILGGAFVDRVVLRRAALFPLRSGTLEIGALEAQVGVFRSIDPFGRGRRNSSVVKVERRSPAVDLTVHPLPEAADVVGRFVARCSEPVAVGSGPVSFEFAVEGEGNLRSAPEPRFERDPGGEVEIAPGELVADRRGGRLRMSRTWSVLLIPSADRRGDLPPIGLSAWNPELHAVEPLRCDPGAPRRVAAAAQPPVRRIEPGFSPERRPDRGAWLAPAGAAMLILAGGLVWLGAARRSDRLRPLEQQILQHRDSPRAMKETVRGMLQERGLAAERLYSADTQLADAYRALWSLLDVLEKEPWEKERSTEDLGRRVREFVRRIARAESG